MLPIPSVLLYFWSRCFILTTAPLDHCPELGSGGNGGGSFLNKNIMSQDTALFEEILQPFGLSPVVALIEQLAVGDHEAGQKTARFLSGSYSGFAHGKSQWAFQVFFRWIFGKNGRAGVRGWRGQEWENELIFPSSPHRHGNLAFLRQELFHHPSKSWRPLAKVGSLP